MDCRGIGSCSDLTQKLLCNIVKTSSNLERMFLLNQIFKADVAFNTAKSKSYSTPHIFSKRFSVNVCVMLTCLLNPTPCQFLGTILLTVVMTNRFLRKCFELQVGLLQNIHHSSDKIWLPAFNRLPFCKATSCQFPCAMTARFCSLSKITQPASTL